MVKRKQVRGDWRRGPFFKQTIFCQGGEAYLYRWGVRLGRLGGIYFHSFQQADDRIFHDHPWDFTSIVLRGGYVEIQSPSVHEAMRYASGDRCRFVSFVVRTVGSIVRHKADDLHFIEQTLSTPCWTLVFTGPRKRTWGFVTPSGWLDWRSYFQRS